MAEDEMQELFQNACSYVRTHAGTLKSDDLLHLYARFKQVTVGPCTVSKPGFFDFQGRQKWEAWHKLGDKSSKDCMLEYINKLLEIDEDWEKKMAAGDVTAKTGMGVAVSTLLASDDPTISDEQKSIFDWCKEGNCEVVQRLLHRNDCDVQQLDENGLALLHWACDRGHEAVVRCLLDYGADINIRDVDGQTPLHYAAACEHASVVRLLMSYGADKTLTDTAGSSALDIADNADIAAILTSG